MDYEKKYNEALAWMREMYPCLTDSLREDAEHYFPELRESEEEKIRKWIASYIHHGVFTEDEHPMALKAVEWLEKQKEITMPNSTELIEMWHKAKAILKEKDFRGDEWRLAQNAFMDGFARGTCIKFEKQKEQKPADRFKEAREKYQVEWSEEDKWKRKELIQYLEEKGDYRTVWMTWLKSLRPSWKPSEEQMEAFRSYIKDFQEKAEAAVGGWNNFDVMIRLFEQLKKLM